MSASEFGEPVDLAAYFTGDEYWQNPAVDESVRPVLSMLPIGIRRHPRLGPKVRGYLSGQPAIPLGQDQEITLGRRQTEPQWFETPGSLLVYDRERLLTYSRQGFNYYGGRPNEERFPDIVDLSTQRILMDAWQSRRRSNFNPRRKFSQTSVEEDRVRVYHRELGIVVVDENFLGKLICRRTLMKPHLIGAEPSPIEYDAPFRIGQAVVSRNKAFTTEETLVRYRAIEVIEAGENRKGKKIRNKKVSPAPAFKPALQFS